MIFNEGKSTIECIYYGDERVSVLLGKQKPPKAGERIRRSCFVYRLYIKGKYLLFHTMTRQIILLPPQYIDYIADDRLFPSSILEQEVPAQLYEDHFLVPEHEQESRTYLELKDILVLKEELPQNITSYVILPTTTCNARCFYCFEQGMEYRKMSSETVEDTVCFIQLHKPKESKGIHIHWFGGEPMCAADNIDRICDGLTTAGIEFSAEMTSNGSLFSEESVKKAAEKWKLGKIQITLDGLAEEYAKRKNYSTAVKDPFGMVIRNIHLLIAAGITVMVRLNVDENNLGEIYRTVDYLKEEFTEEEQSKMTVYAHSLFGKPCEGLDSCPAGTSSSALEAYVSDINDYILRQGLTKFDLGQLFALKSHYCMVTAPECNVLIDSSGELFACDAMPENMHYGNVKTGFDTEAWNRVASPCRVRTECSQCVFLPQCTEFDRCPNRTAYDDCYRQEKNRLEKDLTIVYTIYQEQQEKNWQEDTEQQDQKGQKDKERQDQNCQETDDPDRKEASHVSD